MSADYESSASRRLGTFTPAPQPAVDRPRIIVDGPCVTGTLDAMERGDHGKPMPRGALEAVRTQAGEILEAIVSAYASDVASGEVGAGGRARVLAKPPKSGKCPTGLLYGRVQSGKTAAMIVSAALAIDNGFRVIVVLTSNNLKLVEQTRDRFGDLDGALIKSSLGANGGAYEWERDRASIEHFMRDRGAVFVCAKEDGHLKSLIRFLQLIGATDYPALILDDEADHATPDTRTSTRAAGGSVRYASTTFRLVVENDNPAEPGLSLRETLAHNVFLQVTATPYGLLLQNLTSSLRPAFTRLLKPGQGYTGGEAFFANAEEPLPAPLVGVDELETSALTATAASAPEGLRRSLAMFLVAATAHRVFDGAPPRSGYKYLCHTSVKQDLHRVLERLILEYVDALAREFSEDPVSALARPEVAWALEELKRTVPSGVRPQDVVDDISRYLPLRTMQVVNSTVMSGQLRFDGRYNFLVGGNILGRGLTIDDLIVSYYLRQARAAQMDTMHQHARMFGYRKSLMPYTRVFLTPSLATRFKQIHESETSLRSLLEADGTGKSIPVEIAGDLRPTRSNILDIGALSAYRPGQQVYPVEPVHDPRALGDSIRDLDSLLGTVFGGTISEKVFAPVAFADIIAILSAVRVQNDDGDWNTEAMLKVLHATKARYGDLAFIFVRSFHPSRVVLSSGAISGAEQEAARDKGAPVLFMFRGEKGQPWSADIWYPTLVFPTDMPVMMFNRDV